MDYEALSFLLPYLLIPGIGGLLAFYADSLKAKKAKVDKEFESVFKGQRFDFPSLRSYQLVFKHWVWIGGLGSLVVAAIFSQLIGLWLPHGYFLPLWAIFAFWAWWALMWSIPFKVEAYKRKHCS